MGQACNESLVGEVDYLFKKKGKNELCNEDCSIECNSFTLSMTVNDVFSQSLFEQNKSIIYIFYEDFYYTSITEQPKISSDSLVGTVGGLLGLFLGASLLSFVEFLDLAIDLIYFSFGF